LIIHSKMKGNVMKAIAVDLSDNTLKVVTQPGLLPGEGQVLVKISAAGVNFMDIGVRNGMSSAGMSSENILGVEGAGRIVNIGEGVEGFAVGDRVAWVYGPGSYAEQIVIAATSLVHVPDGIDDRTAASIMMQGLTASHFGTDFYPIKSGDVVFIHAAAGGLGLLLTQIAKMRGATVIGRVSSQAKVAIATEAGADHVVVDSAGEFADEALRLTDGRGVDAIFDGSGPATFQGSLKALRRSGTFCWYGPILGGPGPLDIMSLPKSIKLGYAVFFDHIYTPELLRQRSQQLFNWILEGKLRVLVGKDYRLEDAAKAHADMESRVTTGKLLLVP
jgi:NADPH2:quinone reductase